MVIDPVSATLGVAQAGLGLIQGSASQKAQQQDFLNQQAFQSANAAYAKWQAGLSAQINNANNSFKFWQETVNYNQNLAYVNSLRNFEISQAIQQAEVVRDTRAAAGSNYVQTAEALNQQLQERGLQDAVALQQYRMQRIRMSSAVQARATEGNSVDRLVNDYARQEGDYATLQDINTRLYKRQMTRQQAAAVTKYLEQYSSQQFYTERPYMDPVAPWAPLPTLLTPPPPSMSGGAPANYSGLNIASSLLSGANTYLSSSAALSKYKGSGGGGGGAGGLLPQVTNNTGLAFSGINLMGGG